MKSDGDAYFEAAPDELATVKNQPPFGKLPSFLVSAVICSYLGHQDFIKDLMQRLSKRARGYYIGHKEIVNAFAVEYEPTFEEHQFGTDIYDYDNKFPLSSELRRLSRSKGNLKLSAVVYKCLPGQNGAINAIGLEFADGNKSPLF